MLALLFVRMNYGCMILRFYMCIRVFFSRMEILGLSFKIGDFIFALLFYSSEKENTLISHKGYSFLGVWE